MECLGVLWNKHTTECRESRGTIAIGGRTYTDLKNTPTAQLVFRRQWPMAVEPMWPDPSCALAGISQNDVDGSSVGPSPSRPRSKAMMVKAWAEMVP